MFVALWAAKGGAGTSTVAAALATWLTRPVTDTSDAGGCVPSRSAVLVDLDGDAPAILGMPDPAPASRSSQAAWRASRSGSPGLSEWLTHPCGLPDELDVLPGLKLIPRGEVSFPHPVESEVESPVEQLAGYIASDSRTFIVDCGTKPSGVAAELVSRADVSLVVTRPSWLALDRLRGHPSLPWVNGVVLIHDPAPRFHCEPAHFWHSYGVPHVPIVAEFPHDPEVGELAELGVMRDALPAGLAPFPTLSRGLQLLERHLDGVLAHRKHAIVADEAIRGCEGYRLPIAGDVHPASAGGLVERSDRARPEAAFDHLAIVERVLKGDASAPSGLGEIGL